MRLGGGTESLGDFAREAVFYACLCIPIWKTPGLDAIPVCASEWQLQLQPIIIRFGTQPQLSA